MGKGSYLRRHLASRREVASTLRLGERSLKAHRLHVMSVQHDIFVFCDALWLDRAMPKLHNDLHVRIIQAGMKRFYQIRLLLQFATCRSRPVAGSAGQFVSDVLIDHWVTVSGLS